MNIYIADMQGFGINAGTSEKGACQHQDDELTRMCVLFVSKYEDAERSAKAVGPGHLESEALEVLAKFDEALSILAEARAQGLEILNGEDGDIIVQCFPSIPAKVQDVEKLIRAEIVSWKRVFLRLRS